MVLKPTKRVRRCATYTLTGFFYFIKMEELIKFVKKPNGETARSAKSLYEKLGLNKSHYKKWCERNLLFNEFATYGVDYCSLALGASERGSPPPARRQRWWQMEAAKGINKFGKPEDNPFKYLK